MSKTLSFIFSQDEQNFEHKIFYILFISFRICFGCSKQQSHCGKCLNQKSSVKSRKLIHIKEKFGEVINQHLK